MNKEYINSQVEDTETINIKEELEKYGRYWKWFMLSGLFFLMGAFLYLRYTTPQYSATTTIMIKDNKKSGISAELATFEDLGIIGGGSANNTDNEIEILKSRKIIGNVIDTLNLTVSYFEEGRVKSSEVYKNSLIRVQFIQKDSLFRLQDTIFTISLSESNRFVLFDEENNEISRNHSFNEVIKSDVGDFKVLFSANKNEKILGDKNKITVLVKPFNNVIDGYRNAVFISVINKKSSVLKLRLKHPVKRKAEDFLNELVYQYNKDAITDKNLISLKTSEFINERLGKIRAELALIDDDVNQYKKDKGFTGVPREVELILQTSVTNHQKIIGIETQYTLAKGVKEDLIGESKKYKILASNLGFSNVSVNQIIVKYNELIIERNQKKINAGAKNPVLIEIENQLVSVRQSLTLSLANLEKSLFLQLNRLKKEAFKVDSKIASIPLKERGFIDIARQQEIKAGLYQYLLKKKEETDISLAVTVPNAKIIDVAYGSNIPVSPKKSIIYLAALLLGLLLPFIIIYLKNLLDTKIHSRRDIEELTTIPFLGEIPHSDTDEKIVIGNDTRSSTAESFRLLRTNLDFMLSNKKADDNGKTIFITSTVSGEGKSFTSINLSAALSLSGKKVLLMGMDLRAPKVTEYLGIPSRKGVTNYITDDSVPLDEYKFTIPEVKGLDIISSGVIPPNPAELLMTLRVEKLFEEVKKEYDYIIVDTAPVNLVTDTLLIAKYADMFAYVTRANYLDKRMLVVAQSLYNEKKLPNMAIIINDSDMTRGYGYGYGYGYPKEVVKPWYKKIFS